MTDLQGAVDKALEEEREQAKAVAWGLINLYDKLYSPHSVANLQAFYLEQYREALNLVYPTAEED